MLSVRWVEWERRGTLPMQQCSWLRMSQVTLPECVSPLTEVLPAVRGNLLAQGCPNRHNRHCYNMCLLVTALLFCNSHDVCRKTSGPHLISVNLEKQCGPPPLKKINEALIV
jgi:hypothetical protein